MWGIDRKGGKVALSGGATVYDMSSHVSRVVCDFIDTRSEDVAERGGRGQVGI